MKKEQNVQYVGSTHHPELAQKSEAISKEELDKLKKEKELKEQEKNKANEKVAAIASKIDTLIEELKIDTSKENINDYIDKINEKFEIQEKSLKSKLEEANRLYINVTEERLNIDKFDYEVFKSEFDNKKKSVEDIITRNNAVIENFSKNMKKDLSDKTDIKEYTEDVKKQYSDLGKSFEEICQTVGNLYYEIEEKMIDIDEFDFDEFMMDTEEGMESAIKALKNELAGIRAGRANPLLLEKVQVDYYGTPTPVNQVANVSVPEARMLVIAPWEKSMLSEIEKAILKSDIGITPNSDGKVIRLIFPELTSERRAQLAKTVSKIGEDAKVVVRQSRRNALDKAKKAQKDGLLTEDDIKGTEKDIQDLTDKYIKLVDAAVEDKNKEITQL